MTCTTLVRPLPLSRPWPLRLADDAGQRLAGWARALQVAFRRIVCAQRERQEIEAAAELNETTLRDMGAPEWLQAQAHARREARRFERQLMRVEARGGDGRYY